jgi:hypothetical protein
VREPSYHVRFTGRGKDLELVCRRAWRRRVRGIDAAPSWSTTTIRALARRIAHDRAFAEPPVLGAALMLAGCPDADMIAHCCARAGHGAVAGCSIASSSGEHGSLWARSFTSKPRPAAVHRLRGAHTHSKQESLDVLPA